MKISYNLTGADRKSLVAAISKELNATAKYLGAPSFAYQIGEFLVDKNGTLTGEDNPGLISDVQERHDFVPVDEEYDVPMAMITLVPADEEISEVGLTIGLPRQDFTDTALENLERLIASKATLIKKAIGTDDLALQIDEFTVSFPWFGVECDADKIRAYTHFVTALCEMAKSQSRINSTEKLVDNEKYAFRCFLLRLGFIGNDYKAERKILLQNLTGSSAFKGGGKDE